MQGGRGHAMRVWRRRASPPFVVVPVKAVRVAVVAVGITAVGSPGSSGRSGEGGELEITIRRDMSRPLALHSNYTKKKRCRML